MRIAHLESSLNWGGQELRIIEQTQWLNENGYPTWILARSGSAILREAKARKLPNHEIEFRGSANPKIIKELLDFIRTQKIDLIDAHSNRDASYAMFAKWFSQVTVIRSRHVTTPIKNSLLHRLIWKTGNHGIITTAKAVNRMILELGLASEKNIYAARAGVDSQRYNTSVSSNQLRENLNIPDDHHVISNIGMIRKDKGQLYFVKACELIAQQFDNVTFLQIGEATVDTQSYADEVKQYWESSPHKDRIRFLGYHSDIERYQAISDIVMICSIGTEAQTRLVSQAFLMRNNVVATNVGGLPEMIEHNRTGLICPAADPSALANACIELINSEKLREEIKDNAEHYAYKEMTFERMMEGMLQAYHNALSHLPVNR
ncbi:glycosyl transferase [Hahella sp. CCB-MM4]|uniref:glycosyltransferase family 4 protein n=1 Tax=Hahella sp. (strain CCB-MM4) TaxID=1926491 RepID=UPI000B9B5948|nr:glycosyltransferase family 4 protein [Hahella sp. CCB-MM4]OZG74922.1 glycosyl transferase [Hahella sp. CCB-MM4]